MCKFCRSPISAPHVKLNVLDGFLILAAISFVAYVLLRGLIF